MKGQYKQKISDKFSHIDGMDKVNIEKFRDLRGDSVVLSSFCQVAPSKGAKLARVSAQALGRGEASGVGKFSQLNKFDKRHCYIRPMKFAAIHNKITDFIVSGWYSGTPVTREACYMVVREFAQPGGDLFKQYLDQDKSNA